MQAGIAIEDRLKKRLAELFDRYGRETTELAYLLTGDRDLAQDVSQEAFVRLFGRFAHLRNPEATRSYLRRTVVNQVRSHFRRRRTERRYLEAQPPPLAVEEPALAEGNETLALFHSLPTNQRAAVLLRFYFDLSEQQTAQILDVTPKAVNGLVRRGLNSLRGMSDDE